MDTQRGKSAFTLIELLVVIAIISLLMAVSLPVLHRIRKQARTVACQSNLRQFGIIMDAYAADNRGCFDLTSGRSKNIYGRLLKYAHDPNDLLLCPSASKPALQAHSPVGWLGRTFKAWASLDASGTVDW